MGLVKDIIGEWGSIIRESADFAGRALTERPNLESQVNRPGPAWPRTGDERIRGGEPEVWFHGWQPRQVEESVTTSRMVPNPQYQRAKQACTGRSGR